MVDTHTHTSSEEQRRVWQEAGQALAEYALILAFVSVVAVALTPVGQWVAVRLTDVSAAL